MKNSIETQRLLFREILPSDAEALFELDSDPEVVKYTGVEPLTHIDQTHDLIDKIRQQYIDNRVGRWAVILKESGEFIGWAGLKYIKELNGHRNNYDLGYRFLKRHWGKGYGTESAKAFIDFGFNEMQLPIISAYIDVENVASQKILQNCGMQFVNTFMDECDLCAWYEIKNPNPISASKM